MVTADMITLKRGHDMTENYVLVVISGGNVISRIITNVPDLQWEVLDWDNLRESRDLDTIKYYMNELIGLALNGAAEAQEAYEELYALALEAVIK